MKKLLLFSSLSVMLLVVSCGGSNSGAKSVADKFAKSFFVEMDLDAIRQYVSPELQAEFPEAGNMNELEKRFLDILVTHAKAYNYTFKYDAVRSEVDQNSADIYYSLTAKANPDWTGEGEVELEKRDGKWIVTDYEFDRDESAIDFGF